MNTNKMALVTGASRGIGRAIAENLGKSGHTIVGTATSQKGADSISQYFEALNINGKGLVVNVAEAESIEALIVEIKATYGKTPDILVNNAGITRDNLLMRMKDDDWDSIIQTNLSSVFRLSKACIRGMIKAKFGKIINVGSVVASTGNPGQTNYCAAKAGLIGFTKSLAKEVGARGITVNIVSPGFIDTDMTKALDEGQRKAISSNIPLNRLGQPEEVAAAVGFLASSGADYITGETIHINGGMYMG